MELEPQHPEKAVWSTEQETLTTDNTPEIVTSWSEALENQYTLYELLPTVTNLPAIHAIAFEERYIEKESGELSTNESFLQIGVINLQQPEASDDTREQIKGLVDVMAHQLMDPLEAFQRAVIEKTTPDMFTALNGNRVSIRVPQNLFQVDDDFVENIDDWSTVQHIFETLADAKDYPLHETEEENVYELQLHIELDPIDSALDSSALREPLAHAIDNYQDGVFANKPSMAVTHALDRHLQNTSQKEIADIIGIDSSTVSHHLSSADDWIDRAVHTSDKYRT